MKLVAAYGLGRLAFGAVALLAPAATGRMLAGEGGAAPDAQAFLRGMGGREIGLGLGVLATGGARPWLVAGTLADASDLAGIAGSWSAMAPDKRVPGAAMAGAAAVAGLVLLARAR